MLAKAEEKGLYDHLDQADLSLDEETSGLFTPALAQHRADLVAAADVMMYLGSLETVMPLVSALLKPSGFLPFRWRMREMSKGSSCGNPFVTPIPKAT